MLLITAVLPRNRLDTIHQDKYWSNLSYSFPSTRLFVVKCPFYNIDKMYQDKCVTTFIAREKGKDNFDIAI